MSRIMIIGWAALLLCSCKPVSEPARTAEPVTPAAPVAPDPVGETAAETAWTAEQDRYLAVNVQPADPLEALMWRGVRCDFLSGEIGGDNSAQDRAVQSRMDELRCGEDLLTEARALREARAADPAAVARLDALIAPLVRLVVR